MRYTRNFKIALSVVNIVIFSISTISCVNFPFLDGKENISAQKKATINYSDFSRVPGELLSCKPGSLPVGFCGSGENFDCTAKPGLRATNVLMCKNDPIISSGLTTNTLSVTKVKNKWINPMATCQKGYYLVGSCTSGMNADCGGGYTNIAFCLKDIRDKMRLDATVNSEDYYATCNRGSVGTGFCSSGEFKNCVEDSNNILYFNRLECYHSQDTLDFTSSHNVNGYSFGEPIFCDSNEGVTSFCASGKNRDCSSDKTNYSNVLQCTPFSSNANQNRVTSYQGSYGVDLECGDRESVISACGSGKYGNCMGGNYNNIVCSTIQAGLFGKSRWLEGSFGENLVCNDGEILTGICGSGMNPNCNNNTVANKIKCTEFAYEASTPTITPSKFSIDFNNPSNNKGSLTTEIGYTSSVTGLTFLIKDNDNPENTGPCEIKVNNTQNNITCGISGLDITKELNITVDVLFGGIVQKSASTKFNFNIYDGLKLNFKNISTKITGTTEFIFNNSQGSFSSTVGNPLVITSLPSGEKPNLIGIMRKPVLNGNLYFNNSDLSCSLVSTSLSSSYEFDLTSSTHYYPVDVICKKTIVIAASKDRKIVAFDATYPDINPLGFGISGATYLEMGGFSIDNGSGYLYASVSNKSYAFCLGEDQKTYMHQVSVYQISSNGVIDTGVRLCQRQPFSDMIVFNGKLYGYNGVNNTINIFSLYSGNKGVFEAQTPQIKELPAENGYRLKVFNNQLVAYGQRSRPDKYNNYSYFGAVGSGPVELTGSPFEVISHTEKSYNGSYYFNLQRSLNGSVVKKIGNSRGVISGSMGINSNCDIKGHPNLIRVGKVNLGPKNGGLIDQFFVSSNYFIYRINPGDITGDECSLGGQGFNLNTMVYDFKIDSAYNLFALTSSYLYKLRLAKGIPLQSKIDKNRVLISNGSLTNIKLYEY